jgi:hypothetical protein
MGMQRSQHTCMEKHGVRGIYEDHVRSKGNQIPKHSIFYALLFELVNNNHLCLFVYHS